MQYDEIVSAGMAALEAAGAAKFLNTASETGAQARLNRAYMDAITFETRLIGSRPASTEINLFGARLRTPVIASSLSQSLVLDHLSWDEPYLLQIASGLADAGSAMMTGMVSEDELASIIACGAPVIHIVKPYQDEDAIARSLDAASRLGCIAVGMDIEAVYQLHAPGERPGSEYLEHKTEQQLEQYIRSTRLPFVVKGVLSEADAAAAVAHGAAGVMVSQHGGESIDYAVPVLKALPHARRAAGSATVLVDTGFMRGSDILKALALGADAVGVATLLLIACAAAGRSGVREMMNRLGEEIARNLSLMGCATPLDARQATLHVVATR
ncbi:MAG TPA: alpha-hydroxy-acid oxidizing protein [Candidatus Dormibacteraeota bacterium]|nr:alpha-hydroxy-acid oxidizing protein [Candidatus Dormibacteraeota bacterium]